MLKKIKEMLFGNGIKCDVCRKSLSKVAKEIGGSSLGQKYASNGYTCMKCGKVYCGNCLPRQPDGRFLFFCPCGGRLESYIRL